MDLRDRLENISATLAPFRDCRLEEEQAHSMMDWLYELFRNPPAGTKIPESLISALEEGERQYQESQKLLRVLEAPGSAEAQFDALGKLLDEVCGLMGEQLRSRLDDLSHRSTIMGVAEWQPIVRQLRDAAVGARARLDMVDQIRRSLPQELRDHLPAAADDMRATVETVLEAVTSLEKFMVPGDLRERYSQMREAFQKFANYPLRDNLREQLPVVLELVERYSGLTDQAYRFAACGEVIDGIVKQINSCLRPADVHDVKRRLGIFERIDPHLASADLMLADRVERMKGVATVVEELIS